MPVNVIAMLTQNDVTVPNALAVFEEHKGAQTPYWGFKDDGISFEEGAVLAEAMKTAGKTVVYEPLVDSEEGALRAAEFAVRVGADYVLGLHYPSVARIYREKDIKFFPPFGRRTPDQKLLGTMDELLQAALRVLEQDAYGVRISAYRYIDGDPEALAAHIVTELNKINKPFLITGSINDFDRLGTVKRLSPWGITIGGALFEPDKLGGGSIQEKLDRVTAFLAE